MFSKDTMQKILDRKKRFKQVPLLPVIFPGLAGK